MHACARLTTLPTLALPPACSVIALDRLQNAITTKRAASKRAASCRTIFLRSDTTIEAPSIRKRRCRNIERAQDTIDVSTTTFSENSGTKI